MPGIEDRQMVLTLAETIKEQYGTSSLNAEQFANYLGKTRQYVCEKIRRRELPGYSSGRSYCIPVNAIAMWENRMSKTKHLT